MAHLHPPTPILRQTPAKGTRVRTRIRIPALYSNGEKGSESEYMQCEHVLHSMMLPSGLESESVSIPESVFINVNEPLLFPVSGRTKQILL